MKTSAPALVPFLRSDAQARLLAELLLGPEGEASLSDLAVVMGVNPSSAHREIGRLTEAGMLRERRVGRTRLISVNRDYRFLEPLAQILATAYGPLQAIRRELAEVPSIETVLIFGSYAARFQGHAGPQPADVDVLVIGEPPGRDLRRAAARVEEAIRMPVQVTVISPDEWAAGASGFVRDIQSKPTIPVPMDGDQ